MNGSRRAFLQTMAAAAAVAGVPGSASAIDPIKRRGGPMMQLSLAAYSFRKYLTDYRRKTSSAAGGAGSMTLEDFVDLCAEYGLPGTEPTSYYVPDPLPDKYLQRLRRRAFLAGVTVSGTAIGNTFTHPAGPDRDREIAYTKLWIDRAADMGAPTIRIFAGDLQKGTTEAQARQWCIDAIRECCEYAGRKGVILALENHGGIVATAEQLVSIVREINSEWFGVTWDSGNFRSADPYAELTMIAPYAVTAQIKTKIGGKPADLARVVRILQDVNYRGWLALEYEDEEEPKTAVPKYLSELRRLTATPQRSRG
ncbi:MAG TPA: sugar phosphate isomerase/epimerase family protein [Vicinamibacterales bacterium]|jgi:sugar phosphate isomerase/epimerase